MNPFRVGRPSAARSMDEVGILIALAACPLAACGVEGDRSSPVVDQVPTLSVETDLRVDGYIEDLVSIPWMGVAPDGTMALLQMQDARVLFFDREGTRLGVTGGQGEGPGEFMRPVRGGWKGDTLWVSDTQLRRVTFVSPEPAFVRAMPPLAGASPGPRDADRLPEFPFVFPYAVYPGDTLLLSAQPAAGDPLGERLDGIPVLLRTTSAGTIDRVVHQVPRSESSIRVTFDGGIAAATVPFHPRPLWTVSPDGARIATLTTHWEGTEELAVHLVVMDERGQVVADRRLPFEPMPIPPSIADSAVEAAAERATRPELRRAIEGEARNRMPPVYPAVSLLILGADHRIWLGLRRTGEGRPWLVLSPDGDPEGRVVLAANQTIRVADDQRLWVVESDELGVQSVVRLRVLPPG